LLWLERQTCPETNSIVLHCCGEAGADTLSVIELYVGFLKTYKVKQIYVDEQHFHHLLHSKCRRVILNQSVTIDLQPCHLSGYSCFVCECARQLVTQLALAKLVIVNWFVFDYAREECDVMHEQVIYRLVDSNVL